MKIIKILKEHGIETKVITDKNGTPFVLANNEDGTWTRFDYYSAISLICEYLGY